MVFLELGLEPPTPFITSQLAIMHVNLSVSKIKFSSVFNQTKVPNGSNRQRTLSKRLFWQSFPSFFTFFFSLGLGILSKPIGVVGQW